MQDHGLVSIIMPSHNSAEYIAESIESVIRQTYHNWELLIQEDGSTDNSLDVIEQFAREDRRIKCVARSTAKGAAITRNEALRRAHGQWIAFLDSDDIWAQEKLERQLSFMVKNNYAFTYHEYSKITADGKPMGVSVSGISKVNRFGMMACCWPGCLTVMYDVGKVGLVQIKDVQRNNDTALWLQIVRKKPCYLLKESLAHYRVHENSVTAPTLWGKLLAHYPLFRVAEEMNPVAACFWTFVNVFGNGIKKVFYTKKHFVSLNKDE